MSKDIWKSSTLTLITAIAAITTGALQPSLHVASVSISNLEGTLALAMTRPVKLSAPVDDSTAKQVADPADISGGGERRALPSATVTWSD